MNNLNSLLIEGTLIHDAQLRHTENGTPVCSFSIQHVFYSGAIKEISIFDIQVWGKLGETCHTVGRTGRECRIVGRLRQERRSGTDGKLQSKTTIFAEHVEFRPESAKEQRHSCDHCGKDITHEFYDLGGNCTECGDDLCKDCAVSWDEDGRCKSCQEKDKKEE